MARPCRVAGLGPALGPALAPNPPARAGPGARREATGPPARPEDRGGWLRGAPRPAGPGPSAQDHGRGVGWRGAAPRRSTALVDGAPRHQAGSSPAVLPEAALSLAVVLDARRRRSASVKASPVGRLRPVHRPDRRAGRVRGRGARDPAAPRPRARSPGRGRRDRPPIDGRAAWGPGDHPSGPGPPSRRGSPVRGRARRAQPARRANVRTRPRCAPVWRGHGQPRKKCGSATTSAGKLRMPSPVVPEPIAAGRHHRRWVRPNRGMGGPTRPAGGVPRSAGPQPPAPKARVPANAGRDRRAAASGRRSSCPRASWLLRWDPRGPLDWRSG